MPLRNQRQAPSPHASVGATQIDRGAVIPLSQCGLQRFIHAAAPPDARDGRVRADRVQDTAGINDHGYEVFQASQNGGDAGWFFIDAPFMCNHKPANTLRSVSGRNAQRNTCVRSPVSDHVRFSSPERFGAPRDCLLARPPPGPAHPPPDTVL